MRHAWLMPKLGLTMTEGVLVEWTLAPGARFKAGDCVFVVENDKAASEIAAEHDGVMGAPRVAAGETAPVGAEIGDWDDGFDGGSGAVAAQTAGAAVGPAADAPAHAASPPRPPADAPAGLARQATDAPASPSRRPVTPWARTLARRRGIDLAAVVGSGPRGRVRGRDVQEAQARSVSLPAARAVEPKDEAKRPAAPAPATAPGHVVVFNATQRGVAARLVASKQQAPHFYLTREVEVTPLLELHARLKGAQGEEPRLTLNHFIVAATGRALVARPELNRVWCEEGALLLDRPDVGMAVRTDRGLAVPVLRDAGRLALGALARQANALVERARAGRLAADEMSGGAITVSNAGMHGLAAMASIIVPGQSMILGVGAVRELFRPDAQGAPKLCREIALTLSVDHRALDGVAGAALLAALADALAAPTRLLF